MSEAQDNWSRQDVEDRLRFLKSEIPKLRDCYRAALDEQSELLRILEHLIVKEFR